jgi:hypothetical protein
MHNYFNIKMEIFSFYFKEIVTMIFVEVLLINEFRSLKICINIFRRYILNLNVLIKSFYSSSIDSNTTRNYHKISWLKIKGIGD